MEFGDYGFRAAGVGQPWFSAGSLVFATWARVFATFSP